MAKFKFYSIKLGVIILAVFAMQVFLKGFTELFWLDQNSYLQPWRFLTAVFLHGGVTHLIYNLFALVLFGSMLELLIDGRKFSIIFIVTGVLANLVAVNFYGSSLGASGAIFGVIGALIMIRPWLIVWAFGLPMPVIIAGILWAAGDIIGIFNPSAVGNIAHLSGMFFGLIIGAMYRPKYIKVRHEKHKIDEHTARRWEDSYFNLKKL